MIHMAIGYKGNIVSGVENLDTKLFREFIEMNENVTGTTLGLRGEVIINRDKKTVKIPISFENNFRKSPKGFTSFINTNIDIFKKYYALNDSFDNHLLAKYNIKYRYRVQYNGDIHDALEYKNNRYLLSKGIEYKAIPNLIRIMEIFMTNEGINILPAYLIEFIRDNNLIITKEKDAPDNLVDEYKESKIINTERGKHMNGKALNKGNLNDINEELPQSIIKDTDEKKESKFKRTLREWIKNNIEATNSDDLLYNVDIADSIKIDHPEYDRASISRVISPMITEMFNVKKSYERPNSYIGLHYYGIKIIDKLQDKEIGGLINIKKNNTPPSPIRENKSKGNRYTTEEIVEYTVDNNHLEDKRLRVLNYLEEYFEDQMNQGDGNFL